jgi:DNA-binding Xre family transcriptional regulator
MENSMVKIRLKELLKEHGVSLYKVKEETGIQYTTLHRYKENQTQGIQLTHIEELCKFFKISPDGLFRITHQRQVKKEVEK